jgi:hypothetical protein
VGQANFPAVTFNISWLILKIEFSELQISIALAREYGWLDMDRIDRSGPVADL